MLSDLLYRLRAVFQRRSVETELNDELHFHLEHQIQKYIDTGMTREQAVRQARLEFGGLDQVKEECRQARGVSVLDITAQDLRYAARLLRKSPGFTSVAILSLALGIGANTAIFGLIDAVLLRTLPVSHPEELVQLVVVNPRGTSESFLYSIFESLRDDNQSFQAMFASPTLTFSMNTPAGPVNGDLVDGTYFSTLGLNPILGRAITPEDKDSTVTVLSYGYWKHNYTRDQTVLGQTIDINQTRYTIIGVAPPEFVGVQVGRSADLFLPIRMLPRISPNNGSMLQKGGWLRIVGRLKPGVTRDQARAEMNALFQHILSKYASSLKPGISQEQRIELEAAGTGFSDLRKQFSEPLHILLAVSGLVLLISCTNLANLLVARASARNKETAVRAALGASRSRLIRQFLTESVLLASIGGLVGLFLAGWVARFLVTFIAREGATIALDLRPDLPMLAFTAAISLLTGVLFGLAPALRAVRPMVRNRRRVGEALIAVQVALSLILLIGAGLFLRTLRNLETLDAGFNRKNVLLFQLNPPKDAYSENKIAGLYEDLRNRISSIPGVRSVSYAYLTPIQQSRVTESISVEGYSPRAGEDRTVYFNGVGPKYFETLGTPLLVGRDFSDADNANSLKVAIVNETLARYYFGDSNPIGRHFRMDNNPARPDAFEIIGVVKDAKYVSLREKIPRTAYFTLTQHFASSRYFEVRTEGDPRVFAAGVRQAVKEVAKDVPLRGLTTFEQQVADSLIEERLIATLSSSFGLLALLLACIGLYGIMAYTVTQRISEIGIRMALGAQKHNVMWLVLRQTAVLVSIGLALGVPSAIAAAHLVSARFYNVTSSDPATISIATALMLAVALLAGYLPARKAAQVDPMAALRCE